MIRPTHKITVEVWESGKMWVAEPHPRSVSGAPAVVLSADHPAIVAVEEMPRPIEPGDLVCNAISGTFLGRVVAIHEGMAWVPCPPIASAIFPLTNLSRMKAKP